MEPTIIIKIKNYTFISNKKVNIFQQIILEMLNDKGWVQTNFFVDTKIAKKKP